MMVTGLERHERRGATRRLPGFTKRKDLRVRFARAFVQALADDGLAAGDHAADAWVRLRGRRTLSRQLECATHRLALESAPAPIA